MSRTAAANTSAMVPPGHSRTLSVKSAAITSRPTNISTFLTNLRLLDLDKKPDWPDITAQTFATKDAQQNQKNRIRCVEWTLFRLFEIWDLETTRDKLQPFFPPLEPLQSVNLRGALYRCLNDLKKNGILGRDIILRKTMLDECKGEKLFDILLLFSAAVLRKATTQKTKKGSHLPVARSIATAELLSSSHQEAILPLTIAYKIKLAKSLRRREELGARYQGLLETLDRKDEDVVEKQQRLECEEDATSSIRRARNPALVKKQLEENWTGDGTCFDALLYGKEWRTSSSLLQKPFSCAWPFIEQGQPLSEADEEAGFLDNLETRVRLQQRRLENWKAFRRRFSSGKAAFQGSTPLEAESQPVLCKFDSHYGPPPERVEGQLKDVMPTEISKAYWDILTDMNRCLEDAASFKKHNRPPLPERRSPVPGQSRLPRLYSETASKPGNEMRKEVPHRSDNPVRSGSCSPDMHVHQGENAPIPDQQPLYTRGVYGKSKAENSGRGQGCDHTEESNRHHEPTSSQGDDNVQVSPTTALTPQHHTSTSMGHPCDSTPKTSPESSEEFWPQEASPSNVLAAQILDSVNKSSPECLERPSLPPFTQQSLPSLSQRTRLSMMSSKLDPLVDGVEGKDAGPPVVTQEARQTGQMDEHSDVDATPSFNRRATLIERTRQSMSGLSFDHTKSRTDRDHDIKHKQGTENQRNGRPFHPVGQSQTHRQQRRQSEYGFGGEGSLLWEVDEEGLNGATPKEMFFSNDAEQESVFKSRPKIKLSPLATPADVSFADLGGVGEDQFEEEDGIWDEAAMSSPLVGKEKRSRW